MDDLRSRLEQALAGTYAFQRELGGGGMSRTYLATETALNRRVVVKVLAPELLAGISVERFRREVLLAAQLQHPHVVPVLSAGEAGGLPWFSMPYVDGDSLRQRLGQGPLGITEIVSILRDVARALAYAHAHGIVHRDIKPDNVLLSAGSATVTDFGIAKAISAARTDLQAPNATLTQAGSSIGTPTYMAPEQAAGDPSTDHRADLYAFGAMAYELLAGQPPFTAASPTRLLAAHMGETPRDVRVHRPDTPAALAELVMACLAKDPADRPAEAAVAARVLEAVTSSGAAEALPEALRGGRMRTARALAIWAAASVAVAVTAWAATAAIGLPDWVLPGTAGLALAGLPLILATAFIHRTAHRAYTATPTLTPGGGTAPHGTLATLALKASPHVSWRRTWLGGGLAVGAFALLVVAFMVTRALGIGPAASLRGAGTFGEQETLVVADFRAPPGDSLLGPTVSEALRTDLAQSRNLRVMTRASVRDILARMLRNTESAVPFEVAREIATREGAKAVLDGEIVQLGRGYVVSARLVAALDGAELAAFRETADGEDALIAALGRLSRSVREKAGESLRGIRKSYDIDRVTTPSLAALRKYVEGQKLADDQGELDRGLALLREAVTIDTGFAMAWRKIAVLLGNEQRSRDDVHAALRAAYRHRDRLTDLERLITEGTYFTRGPEPDPDRALAAYEQAMQLDSMLSSAINNSALIHGQRRDYAREEALYRRATQLPNTFGGAFTNLMSVQVRRGDSLAVDSTAAAFRRRFPESRDLWAGDLLSAWVRDDIERSDSIARAAYEAGRDSRRQVRGAFYVSRIAELRGRSAESLRWSARGFEAMARTGAEAEAVVNAALDTAYLALTLDGDRGRALAVLERMRARRLMDSVPAASRPWSFVAQMGALAGLPDLAREALAGARRDVAPLTRDSAASLFAYEGAVAMAEQRWDDAAAKFREADRTLMLDEQTIHAVLGFLHDRAGRPDSALAHFDGYLAMRSAYIYEEGYWRPRIHRWAGELREQRGDRAAAIRHYEAFLRYWRDADPALQPEVRDVRERLARLRAQAG